jgi:DNA polymerase (family 10)
MARSSWCGEADVSALDASAVARLLVEIGRRTALAGDNYFRAKAYQRAADSLSALVEPLDRVIAEDRLRQMRGIGETIADIVIKLHRTGTHPLLEKLRKDFPESVLDMLSIPGLKPEKIHIIHKELGIADLAGLEAAARAGRLKSVKRLRAALQRKILAGLEIRKRGRGARHLHRANELAEVAARTLERTLPGLRRTVIAGDIRRGGELVSNLALVGEIDRLQGPPKVITAGDISVHLTDAKRFGITLLRATGSDRHVEALARRASEMGMALTPEGLSRGRKVIAARAEDAIYTALDLQYVEPELREGLDEVERAEARNIPPLVRAEDLRGILHAHTTASDGADTLEAMAEASLAAGYEYIGITDHSKTAHYAGGLTVEEIEQQHAEIDRLNASFAGRFHIFKGIESDILPDGSLDYPDDVLRRFDLIIGSIHGQFRLDRTAQTERLVRAASNPFVTVIGHMTGRQLLRRPGYEVDIERVLAACAEHGVAVEVNGNPWRLDLDWRWLRRGLELGCSFSINPDAHSTGEIASSTRWGLAIARKSGMAAERVINAFDRDAFARWLRARKKRVPIRNRQRQPA